jgi:hypothetical protein
VNLGESNMASSPNPWAVTIVGGIVVLIVGWFSRHLRKERQNRSVVVPVGFGQPDEWRHFINSHPLRIPAIQNALATAEKVFLRTIASDKPSDRVGFYLGRICVEDFNEILLLAGNGNGIGALKVLRGMFERAVTSAYVLQNPGEAERFLDYHKVHKYKAYNHAKKLGAFGPKISDETVKQIQDEFSAVKANYMEEICVPCGKKRLMSTWTKLDTASMAHKVGKGYEDIYYDAFYQPTLQVHSTVASLMARLEISPRGTLTFKCGAQRNESDKAVILAHNLLLRVLDSQNRHFGFGLDGDLQKNLEDFPKAYDSKRQA